MSQPNTDQSGIYDTGSEDTQIIIGPYGELMTTSEVRSVFALSEAELSDEMLTSGVYTWDVSTTLTETAPKILTDWDRLNQSTDPKDVAIVGAFKHYAIYAYCNILCDILPMVVARIINDSKASFQRFDYDIDKVATNIKARATKAKQGLLDLIDALIPPQILPQTIFVAAKPTFDPVTGSGGQ